VLETWEIESFKQRHASQDIARTLDKRLMLIYDTANPYYLYHLTGTAPAAPRVVEAGDMHLLRSTPPDPAAFDPQLGRR